MTLCSPAPASLTGTTSCRPIGGVSASNAGLGEHGSGLLWLRGYDAVHLATALASGSEALVTADLAMVRAASAAGLVTVDANG